MVGSIPHGRRYDAMSTARADVSNEMPLEHAQNAAGDLPVPDRGSSLDGPYDMLIAALAWQIGVTVVTNNE